MTSTLTLYVGTKLDPKRNMKIDDLSSYLSSFTGTNKIIKANFQYIKHRLDLEIKVDMSQTNLNILNLNYCSIQNGSERTRYYFIIGKEWISENTIKLHLQMDTLNTWIADSNNLATASQFKFNPKTHILRQHKQNGTYTSTLGDTSVIVTPVIDFNSEGILAPKYVNHTLTKKIYENANPSSNRDWYLVYKNQNDPDDSLTNPVECWLYPSADVTSTLGTGIMHEFNFLNPSGANYPQQTDYRYCTFSYVDNGRVRVDINSESATIKSYFLGDSYNLSSLGANGNFRILSITFKEGDGSIPDTDVVVYIYGIELEGAGAPFVNTLQCTTSNLGGRVAKASFYGAYYRRLSSYASIASYPNYSNISDVKEIYYVLNGNIGTLTIKSFNSMVDRTDPKLIKIIKLPYCPVTLETDSIAYYWLPNFVNGTLKLFNFSIQFKKTLSCYDDTGVGVNPFDIAGAKQHTHLKTSISPLDQIANIKQDKSKMRQLEPKMLHSDFYEAKIFYDSFSLPFAFEKLATTTSLSSQTSLQLDYCVTSTINSRFMFRVNNYVTNKGSSDFDNLLYVARNNEMTLFNQAYINYIRTGFNYDVKSKTLQHINTWTGAGLGILAGAVSGAVAGGGVGAVAGAVIGLAGGTIRAITSTIQAENTFEQKQTAIKNQATQVFGADDVDLMTEYCSNKLIYSVYEVSNMIFNQVFDLFYYFGYIDNVFQVPSPTTKSFFDFVQCDPVFEDSSTLGIREEEIDDIKLKFNEGVTFFHKFTFNLSTYWDLQQIYANYDKAFTNFYPSGV